MLWTSVSSVSKIRPDNGNYRTLNLPQGGQQVQAAVELVALAPDVILATGSASLGPLLTGHSQRADRFCDRPRSGWRGIRGQSRQARLLRRPLRGLAGALTLPRPKTCLLRGGTRLTFLAVLLCRTWFCSSERGFGGVRKGFRIAKQWRGKRANPATR